MLENLGGVGVSKAKSYGRQDKTQTSMTVSLDKDLLAHIDQKSSDLRMNRCTYIRQLILKDMQDEQKRSHR